eukprot:m.261481 g.261481  ORF g.261481 m.261481 type:complete len:583 (+) comp44942_c0_seq1:242-1990(+)
MTAPSIRPKGDSRECLPRMETPKPLINKVPQKRRPRAIGGGGMCRSMLAVHDPLGRGDRDAHRGHPPVSAIGPGENRVGSGLRVGDHDPGIELFEIVVAVKLPVRPHHRQRAVGIADHVDHELRQALFGLDHQIGLRRRQEARAAIGHPERVGLAGRDVEDHARIDQRLGAVGQRRHRGLGRVVQPVGSAETAGGLGALPVRLAQRGIEIVLALLARHVAAHEYRVIAGLRIVEADARVELERIVVAAPAAVGRADRQRQVGLGTRVKRQKRLGGVQRDHHVGRRQVGIARAVGLGRQPLKRIGAARQRCRGQAQPARARGRVDRGPTRARLGIGVDLRFDKGRSAGRRVEVIAVPPARGIAADDDLVIARLGIGQRDRRVQLIDVVVAMHGSRRVDHRHHQIAGGHGEDAQRLARLFDAQNRVGGIEPAIAPAAVGRQRVDRGFGMKRRTGQQGLPPAFAAGLIDEAAVARLAQTADIEAEQLDCRHRALRGKEPRVDRAALFGAEPHHVATRLNLAQRVADIALIIGQRAAIQAVGGAHDHAGQTFARRRKGQGGHRGRDLEGHAIGLGHHLPPAAPHEA